MSLDTDPAADQARRYDEFHAWERARPALEAKKERELAAARHQGRVAAVTAAMPTRTAIPQALDLRAIVGDVADLGIRTDPGFRAAMARYTEARNDYWAALWTGERKKIDAAIGAIVRSTADCFAAALAVAIQEQRNNLQKVEDRLTWAERDRDQARRDLEALQQQPVAPLQVELKLPSSLPDLNVKLVPSAGVELEYDAHGRVKGTRPRGTDPVTKALKKTQAGQSIAP
jgi:hypothetical protein